MEIIQQVWANSRPLRIAVYVTAVSLILLVLTAGRNPAPNPTVPDPSPPSTIIDKLKDRAGGGVAGKYGQATGQVAEAVGKVARTTGRVADTVGKGIEAVDGVVDRALGKPRLDRTSN